MCRPSGEQIQPAFIAIAGSPSNQALPSLMRRPVRSSMRVERLNSTDLKAWGLQTSQKRNFRMLITMVYVRPEKQKTACKLIFKPNSIQIAV